MLVYLLIFAMCLVAAAMGRSRYAAPLLIVALVVFVGLRYETGFDWPVYKAEWAHLYHQIDLGSIVRYQSRYHEELGFLGLLTALTWVFPEYEYAQFMMSVGLILSVVYLINTLKIQNVALCLIVITTYLAFSLFFSVVRQAVAVSVFNVGLSLYFRDRRKLGIVAIVVSAVFQYSAVIYIFAFFVALIGKRYAASISLMRWALAIGSTVLIVEIVLFVVGHFLRAYLPVRIATYLNLPLGIDLWSLTMFIAFTTMAIHAGWPSKNVELSNRKYAEFRRLLVVLGAVTAGSALVPILRERAAYEFWVLYAIYLCMAGTFLGRAAIACALAFGVYCSAMLFKYPTSLMLVPYQNFAVARMFGIPSTGQARYEAFIAIVSDNMAARQGRLLPSYGHGVAHGHNDLRVHTEHDLIRR